MLCDPVGLRKHEVRGELVSQGMHDVVVPVSPALALPQMLLQQLLVALQVQVKLGQRGLCLAQLPGQCVGLGHSCCLSGLRESMNEYV